MDTAEAIQNSKLAFNIKRELGHLYFIPPLFLLFYFLKSTLFNLPHLDFYPLFVSIALVLTCLSIKAKYPEGEIAATRFLRGITLIIGFYLVILSPGYITEDIEYYQNPYSLKWISILFSALAIWRPGFALLPILQVIWIKHADISATGIYVSATDYMPVVELGTLLWISFLLLPNLTITSLKNESKTNFRDTQKLSHFETVVIIAVAIHFGNYFHSAVAKLLLDGGVFTWVFENKTHYLSLTSAYLGLAPISNFKDLWWLNYLFLSKTSVAFNLIILVAQLACLVAICRVKWAILLTIFYDLTHVIIFFLTGIFFWKWILLNLVIVGSLSAFSHKRILRPTSVAAGLTIVFGILIFFTARLGWYDTRMLKDVYITAKSDVGKNYRIPTNYFMNASLTFAQSRAIKYADGHVAEANSLGSVMRHQTATKYNECEPILMRMDYQPPNLNKLKSYIRKHHQFILEKSDKNGKFNYDFFPHHMWSNPMEFVDFKDLDKRSIVSYTINIDSVCVTENSGIIDGKLFARSKFIVEL